MRDRTVNRVESWDARAFSGGFATLRDLADAGFSGVVVSGDAWLFMLNGRVVGIVDGDIDDFEEASGTMYEAPDPSLPLLFSMQERDGESQAKYYTNDTPLQEADRTLSDANFTGFVELSENVLSGDYYLVYYGGRVLPVAFVGTTDELKTGDEAYDLACDEVGVYEVIKTPVNVTQVPEPAADEGDTGSSEVAGGAAGAGSAASASSKAETSESGTGDAPESADSADSGVESTAIPDAESADSSGETVAESAAEPTSDSSSPSSAESSSPIESASDPSTGDTTSRPASDPASDTPTDTAYDTTTDTVSDPEDEPSVSATSSPTESSSPPGNQDRDDPVFSEEEQWRQTKSIPSLSPSEREKRRQERRSAARSRQDQSAGSNAESAGNETDSPSRSPQKAKSAQEDAETQGTGRRRSQQGTRNASRQSTTESTAHAGADSGAKGQDANSVSEPAGPGTEPAPELQERIDELESQLETLDSERASLSSDLDSVREERDELKKRVRELEQALEDSGGETSPGPVLSPDDALAGTNLFVRYGSKGKPTLDALSGKNPDREAINKNLRIDHHTQFEAQEATVDGRPFQAFLEASSSYRFVSWLVRELPYEILDSGQRSGLGDFYDVVSEIDRAELQGVVEVETEDGDQERREFDIVLRDRMGNPLVVAELNDERDPVSGNEMESLVESARVVGDGADDLGAAFYVTASFFEPDALENAGEATANGGILSRSDRMSYVKLARKQGFHLCLTEDRNETFHLTVPEL